MKMTRLVTNMLSGTLESGKGQEQATSCQQHEASPVVVSSLVWCMVGIQDGHKCCALHQPPNPVPSQWGRAQALAKGEQQSVREE